MFKSIPGSRTLGNFNRKADRYGDVHFISFLGSTLSRLAYFNDNQFLENYKKIVGPVITQKILTGINSVNSNNLGDLLDDQKIFGLNDTDNIFIKNEYTYEYNDKKFIDFIKLNMPQNINIINGELSGEVKYMITGNPRIDGDVKYISIGWSNYGEIYVVADKRMPNTILLIFRGTYSAKTMGLYSKATSIVPLDVCEGEKFLYGIFKPTVEMIHTIIETLRYLATDFLGAKDPNSVKIFTTGHSLGGAMCTNFAYLWMGIKKTEPYNSDPYKVLADNIVCVSLGSPRGMGSSVAQKFCNFASEKKILYLRITSRGDPIPGLPPKTGFEHPCSTNEEMRKTISEDCNANLTTTFNVDYKADLDCQNYKTRTYLPNPKSHMIYLDIKFSNAVDIPKFLKGIGIAQEVSRGPDKSTICRLIMGYRLFKSSVNDENVMYQNIYNAIFFDVNKARESASNLDSQEEAVLVKKDDSSSELNTNGSNEDNLKGAGFTSSFSSLKQSIPKTISSLTPSIKIGGEVAEDVRMSSEAFNSLIQQMVPLEGEFCPLSGTIVNPFNETIMPKLSCVNKTTSNTTSTTTTTTTTTQDSSNQPAGTGTGIGGRKKTQRKRKGKSKKNRSRRY